jgi:CHAT domain-containing protein/tetratricopeptide (TPR) repeat protein
MDTRAALLALVVLSVPAAAAQGRSAFDFAQARKDPPLPAADRVPQTSPATPSAEEELAQAEQLMASGERAAAATDTATARNLGRSALEIFERRQHLPGVARANVLLGNVLDLEGQRAEAARHFDAAILAYESLGDARGRAIATLGLLRTSQLSHDEARRAVERGVLDARSIGDKSIEGALLHSLADKFFAQGEYADALTTLEEAARLLAATESRDALGTVYNSMGRLYRAHGQLETALEYQQKALAIHRASGMPFTHLQSLNAVAVTYESLGDFGNALTYYKQALALAEKSSSPRIQDFIRANLANVMRENANEYAEVAKTLEGVLARGLDAFPSRRQRELAWVYLKLGRLNDALVAAERAVELCGAREGLDCVRAMAQRSQVKAALGRHAEALQDVQAALRTIESVRARLVPADFFKQQFNVGQEETYSNAIALQLRADAPGDALQTAELARARAFVDLLASKNLPLRDAPVVLAKDAPGATLASQAAAPSANVSDLVATAARLGSTLLVYWTTHDAVFIWVVPPTGKVVATRVDVPRSRLADLIRATAPFPEPAPGGQSRPVTLTSELACVDAVGNVVSQSNRLDSGPGPAPKAPTQASCRVIATRGANTIGLTPTSKAWRQLYDLLVKPVRGSLPRSTGALLTIVPHGPLSALAFAALQDERGRYFLEDYTLHYVPAGAVLQFTAARRQKDSRSGRMLMVADPVPPALSSFERPLPRLPGARAESRAIASLIPRTRMTVLEGNASDEPAVRSASDGKAVLHFATHAIVRDDAPFSSFLAVGRPMGGDDGMLTAEEIYGLSLDADLVVLSACRSAGGRVTGDGIATFARAFIYAGVPSLVASMWDVADEPTNRLLPGFYRTWLGGATKARALRRAQLDLLNELRTGKVQLDTPAGLVSLPEHPVFWAGFALLGEPE